MGRAPRHHVAAWPFAAPFLAVALGSWQQARDALVARNPLYGRVLTRAELPTLHRLIEQAQALPPDRDFRIAYLIQGEEDASEAEAVMWGRSSEVFLLTFRMRRRNAIFFPGSLLAEGRNALLASAAAEELARGRRFRYYVFLDADAEALPSWSAALPVFLGFLRDWEPAVGLPQYPVARNFTGNLSEPRSIFGFDHIFMAVHADAAPALLPYNATFDGACMWVSQWVLTLLASAVFMNHVLVLPSVSIRNPNHSDYAKADCDIGFSDAVAGLRASVPAAAQTCFPSLQSNQLVKLGENFWSEKDVYRHWITYTNYQQWGVARTKRGVASVAHYRGRSLSNIGPCVGETKPLFPSQVLSTAMQGSSLVDFCRGCSPEEVLELAQAMVAVQPFSPTSWNLLGLLINAGGNPVLGLACLVVARRLCEVRRLPVETVESNIADVLSYHRSIGLQDTLRAVDALGGYREPSLVLEALAARGPRQQVFSRERAEELVSFLTAGGGAA